MLYLVKRSSQLFHALTYIQSNCTVLVNQKDNIVLYIALSTFYNQEFPVGLWVDPSLDGKENLKEQKRMIHYEV